MICVCITGSEPSLRRAIQKANLKPSAGSRTFSQTVNTRHLGGVMITISIFCEHVIPQNRASTARTQVLLSGLARPAFYPSGLVPARGLTCT
jgi:hypothetical protein